MMRLVLAVVGLGLVGIACAPDPLDTYTVSDAAPATLPPLPTTTAPPEGDEVEPVPAFPANGTTVEVRSLDNSFVAASIEIEAGTEVLWVNGGRNDHNVLPVDESLDWGVERDALEISTGRASHSQNDGRRFARASSCLRHRADGKTGLENAPRRR